MGNLQKKEEESTQFEVLKSDPRCQEPTERRPKS